MKRAIGIICLLAFTSIAGHTQAQSDLAGKLMRQLQPDSTKWCLELMKEEVVPYDTSETIFLLPEYTGRDETGFVIKVWLIIADNTSGAIKQQFSDHYYSDSTKLIGFTLDPGPIRLTPEGVRAFSVRTAYQGISPTNPSGYTSIALYIRNGSTLDRVMRDIHLSDYLGSWDMKCTGEFRKETMRLTISSKVTNGYFEMVLYDDHVIEKKFVNEKGECVSKLIKSEYKFPVIFENGEYNLSAR